MEEHHLRNDGTELPHIVSYKKKNSPIFKKIFDLETVEHFLILFSFFLFRSSFLWQIKPRYLQSMMEYPIALFYKTSIISCSVIFIISILNKNLKHSLRIYIQLLNIKTKKVLKILSKFHFSPEWSFIISIASSSFQIVALKIFEVRPCIKVKHCSSFCRTLNYQDIIFIGGFHRILLPKMYLDF